MTNQNGGIAIITAILLTVFLGFTALSVDTGYLVASRNELQNAADAGALAGARELYNDDGAAINLDCNQVAYDTALKNTSANFQVEVNWTSGNTGDIQRGHWSWGRGDLPRGFTPDEEPYSLEPVRLWNVSDADLDDNLDHINAVRVTTRREVNPIATFFGKIFDIDGFTQSTTAVAYIGYAGSFAPFEIDAPIAICEESITSNDDVFDCSIGRMINSGNNETTSNTGGWTDFEQPEECQGADGVNSNYLISLMDNNCGDFSGNPTEVTAGNLETGGGQNNSVYSTLRDCWESYSNGGTRPWKLKLPVVRCPGNNVSNCSELVGAVTVEILWISGNGTDPQYNDPPTSMESGDDQNDDWSWDDIPEAERDINGDGVLGDGKDRWESFVTHFGLMNVDGSPAPYAAKSIYFKPSCDVAVPSGDSSGKNLGVLARFPVLVK